VDATRPSLFDTGGLFIKSCIKNQQIDVNKTFENKFYQPTCCVMVVPMVYPREKLKLNSLTLG